VSWVQVRVTLREESAREAIVAALIQAGAAAVQEMDASLLAHLPHAADFAALRETLRERSPSVAAELTPVGEIDWTTRWPPRVGVQRVGRLAVAPPWLAPEIQDSEHPIIIEPATAFGTGEHETTRGVLQLMQQVLKPGDVVADLGTGSAVLAIAAAKLGATRVAAIELDVDAIGNAEENVRRNNVGHAVTVLQGDAVVLLPLVAPVRVILANIISSVLLELSPAMRAALAPGGRAILSGILVSEREGMLQALGADAWALEAEQREGEWWSSVVAPR
jgi:ribosomal protein L11 methyltransferase